MGAHSDNHWEHHAVLVAFTSERSSGLAGSSKGSQ